MSSERKFRDTPWATEYDGDRPFHRIYDAQDRLLGEVGSLTMPYEEQDSIASLWKAAPDLLEALGAAMEEIAELLSTLSRDPNDNATFRECSFAIARAQGKK